MPSGGEALVGVTGSADARRLRPTAPIAADAVLVGDPGRALMLAQALLEEPKMSNHARGLWGYSGRTPAGRELTIQATGMGGPSAALVLADLAELGVRRAVRVGTCVAIDPEPARGRAAGRARGARLGWRRRPGAAVLPDPSSTAAAARGSWDRRRARPSSPASTSSTAATTPRALAERATRPTCRPRRCSPRAEELGVAVAAVLLVAESGRAGSSGATTASSKPPRSRGSGRGGRSLGADSNLKVEV